MDELMNERTFEVRKLNRYKTRWACLVFEPGDTERSWQTGCDYGRKFSSKKKAEKFGEHVLQLLSNQKEQQRTPTKLYLFLIVRRQTNMKHLLSGSEKIIT